MRQVAEELDLLAEAAERAAAPRADPEHLDRDRVARLRADPLQHHAAAALAEEAGDLVLADHRRDLWRRRRLIDRARDIHDRPHDARGGAIGLEHGEDLRAHRGGRMALDPGASLLGGQVADCVEQRRGLAIARGGVGGRVCAARGRHGLPERGRAVAA
jgi:hypothetical protein